MSAIWRTRLHPSVRIASVLLAIFAALTVAAAATPPAAAQSAAGPSYVKYYIVQSAFDGQPEDLAEIAARFLGSTSRSTEIFDLNKGVPQPGGGELTNPAIIDPGWVLVPPWDAVGPGVQYGVRPTTPPAVSPAPATSAAPTKPAKAWRRAKASPACARTPANAGGSPNDWGMLRVAPQHAWPYSRGAGVTVAIVDSGVDASAPGLAGESSMISSAKPLPGRQRHADDAIVVLDDLRSMLASPVQLSTDGHKMYLTAVPATLGDDIDYCQVVQEVRAQATGTAPSGALRSPSPR